MFIDLVLLGVIARVLLGAAHNAVACQREAVAVPLPPPPLLSAEEPGTD